MGAGGAALALAGTTAATVATVATAVAVSPGGVVLHLLILEVLIPRAWTGVLIPMAKSGMTSHQSAQDGVGSTPIWTSTSLGAGFATETWTAPTAAMKSTALALPILEVLIPRAWAGTTTIGGLGNTPIWTSSSLGAGFATETWTAPTAPMKSTATAALALAITKTIYNTYDD